jgi:hypothetical protein
VFTPQRVPHHVLTDTLSSAVLLRVPQAFKETLQEGNAFAGRLAWSYGDCDIGLAWAPGPTEPLLIDNAQMILEATFDPAYEISITGSEGRTLGSEETHQWTGFLFQESWQRESKQTPAETLVVQGPEYRLYALRVRAKSEAEIGRLCRDVAATLGFVTE